MSDIISGRNSVREALLSENKTINKILLSRQAHGSAVKEIIKLAKERRIPLHHVPPERFDRLQNQNNQGVLAEISPVEYINLEDLLAKVKNSKKTVLVVLDSIEDPHNLGAIIRNAAAFGVNGVIIGKWRSVNLTETVTRTSAGASHHIPIARVPNIAECLSSLKEAGFWVAGADTKGASLNKVKSAFPLALVIGGEGQGIRRLVKDRCDALVSIPQNNVISSINASCAAAILLYEISKLR